MANIVKLLRFFSFAVVYLFSVLPTCAGLQTGDRVSSMLQSLHGGWRTSLMDISLQQMPRFRMKDSTVIRVTLPRESDNSPEMKLNQADDVKISLTFDNNKLVVPWIVLYDAANRRTLRRLIVTFSHDEFEILRFRYDLQYGPPISRFDPNHPSLTAFEIDYNWEPVNENDMSTGLVTLFAMGFTMTVVLAVVVTCFADRKGSLKSSSSKPTTSIGTRGRPGR